MIAECNLLWKRVKKIMFVIIVVVLITVLLFFISEKKKKIIPYLNDIPDNCEYIYNVLGNEICLYNYDENRIMVNRQNGDEQSNVFTYGFTMDNNIYTLGDSYNGEFSIINIKADFYDIIYSSNEKQVAIFPLAEKDGMYFFTKEIDDEYGNMVCSQIVSLNEEGKLVEFQQLSDLGFAYSGVIIGDELYFTIYNQDKECFDLYKWNYVQDEENIHFCNSGLDSGEIFSWKNQVYYSENGTFLIGNQSITCGEKNIMIQDDIFLSFYYNQGRAICEAFSIEKGDRIFKKANIVGYKYEDGNLYLYSEIEGKVRYDISDY